jgi:branched-chain amino acid transport system permease protein
MMPFEFLVFAQAGGQAAIDKFANATSSGIALGAIYALLALGLVLIYKATQVLNFAHGALAALGAFFAAYLATVINFPGRYATFLPVTVQWLLSALVAVLITAVVGLVLERLAIRPMIGEPLFSVVMITIALDIVIRTITDDFIGTNPRPLGDPWGADVVNIGPAVIAKSEIATLIVTVICLVGIALFFRTRYGVAMRATAFDQEAAMAQGISAGRIFAIAWAIGRPCRDGRHLLLALSSLVDRCQQHHGVLRFPGTSRDRHRRTGLDHGGRRRRIHRGSGRVVCGRVSHR